MKSGLIVIAVSMFFSTAVLAGGPPPFGGGDSSATAGAAAGASSSSNSSATGVGVGVGTGGDASSYSEGGNAYSGVKNNNSNVGVNSQGQEQGQYQGNVGVNKATGSGNSTTIRSNADVDAEPAIAPSMSGDVSNITCFANVGGSLAGGGVFAFGIQAVHHDEQCTYRANAEYVDRFFGREVARNYAVAYFQDPKGILPGNEASDEETAAIERHDEAMTQTDVYGGSTAYHGSGDKHNPYGL